MRQITAIDAKTGQLIASSNLQALGERYQVSQKTLREWRKVIGIGRRVKPNEQLTDIEVAYLDDFFVATRVLNCSADWFYHRVCTSQTPLDIAYREDFKARDLVSEIKQALKHAYPDHPVLLHKLWRIQQSNRTNRKHQKKYQAA